MKKTQREELKRENIISDLLKIERERRSYVYEWRLLYIVPFAILSVSIGILTQRIWVGCITSILYFYHIVKLILKLRISNKRIKAIKNGEFTVTLEKLTNICEETIYEPHTGRRRTISTKEVTIFWLGSSEWRLIPLSEHYNWSKEYFMGTSGLYNTSVIGNEFYTVVNNFDGKIDYIYNTKFFIWNE